MTAFQIPRNSLAWLLAAQLAVIAPHVGRLPLWVTLMMLGCCCWRVMVYQGRWSYPGRWTKSLFVLTGLLALGFGSKGHIYGLESAVALLVIAFSLKLLEMQHKRDAYIVILLGYFVVITEFLFFQSIPYTLYMLGAVVLLTAALIGLNQTQSHRRPTQTLKLAATLLAQSLPMMLVLFVLFPRISPLWTLPLESQAAKSGVTDQMRPGDVASLSLSPDLAFTVTFSGPVPAYSQLYWRGLVLEDYDGKTWRRRDNRKDDIWRDGPPPPAWTGGIERLGPATDYSIILEPTRQHWLFSLAAADLPDNTDVAMLADYTLAYVQRRGLTSKFKYAVSSNLDYRLATALDESVLARNTRLPAGVNPRSRALARAMRAASSDQADYVRRVMTYFNREGFVYTLQPPILGDNDIDEFLFDQRRGFCEHYAGSFVFMLRAAGVPARVVLGYQGGEYNDLAGFMAIRQFDAHAWAEVWSAEQGWVRVDPTQMVAPERIERGLEMAVAGEDTFLADSPLSWLKYRQLLWLTELRMQVDAIGHYWDNWVVGYNPQTQLAFLSRYLQDVNASRIGMLMLGGFFTMLALVSLMVLRKPNVRVLSGVDQQYLRFCQMLSKQGLARMPGEGPQAYCERLGQARPSLAQAAKRVTELYLQLNYADDTPAKTAALKKAVSAFRFKALTADS